MKPRGSFLNMTKLPLLGVLLTFGVILTGCGSAPTTIASMTSKSSICEEASKSIVKTDLEGKQLFSEYTSWWKSKLEKNLDSNSLQVFISKLDGLYKNDEKLYEIALANSGCFSQSNLNKIEYVYEITQGQLEINKFTEKDLPIEISKIHNLYPAYISFSETLDAVKIPSSFMPTATPTPAPLNNSPAGKSDFSNGNVKFTDSRISLELDGTPATLFSPIVAVPGYITGRVNLTNITHSPISLHAINYLVDSEGNSYAGIEMGQCVSNWQLDLNPKEFGSVTGCFQIADGTVLTKFWAKDVVTGKPIFSIPLKQTVTSN